MSVDSSNNYVLSTLFYIIMFFRMSLLGNILNSLELHNSCANLQLLSKEQVYNGID